METASAARSSKESSNKLVTICKEKQIPNHLNRNENPSEQDGAYMQHTSDEKPNRKRGYPEMHGTGTLDQYWQEHELQTIPRENHGAKISFQSKETNIRNENSSCGAEQDLSSQHQEPPSCEELHKQLWKMNEKYRNPKSNFRDLRDLKSKLQAENENLAANLKKFEKNTEFLLAHLERSEEKNEYLLANLNHYKSLWFYASDKCFAPFAVEKKVQWNGKDASSIDHVLSTLLQEALEASALRTQIHSLQHEMLGNVEKSQAVSDEQFTRDFSTLASAVKSFSRAIKVPAELNITDIDALNSCLLIDRLPKDFWATGARKKSLIEAYVWSVLILRVFQGPFEIFGWYRAVLSEAYFGIFGDAHNHHWPIPSELAEHWRHTTAEQFVQIVGRDAITKISNQHIFTEIGASINMAQEEIINTIETVLTPISPSTNFSLLKKIVEKAFALALEISLQRSRIQITVPTYGEPFIAGKCPSLTSIAESEDVDQGHVAFTVSPGLTKWGDAHGKNLKHRLDLCSIQGIHRASADQVRGCSRCWCSRFERRS